MTEKEYQMKQYEMIRWHGLREYQKTEVLAMRGFTGDGKRYELDKDRDGQWRVDYAAGEINDGLSSNTLYRFIAKDQDILKVIQAAEEHAYKVSLNENEELD